MIQFKINSKFIKEQNERLSRKLTFSHCQLIKSVLIAIMRKCSARYNITVN